MLNGDTIGRQIVGSRLTENIFCNTSEKATNQKIRSIIMQVQFRGPGKKKRRVLRERDSSPSSI